jgi:hypothetical protein
VYVQQAPTQEAACIVQFIHLIEHQAIMYKRDRAPTAKMELAIQQALRLSVSGCGRVVNLSLPGRIAAFCLKELACTVVGPKPDR